nr:MAG TPA: RPA3 [Caudoviricetes sp.]
MAVDGSMLNKYVGKKIKIFLVNEQGILKGKLTKDSKKFILKNEQESTKLTISKISAIKEED